MACPELIDFSIDGKNIEILCAFENYDFLKGEYKSVKLAILRQK